MSVRDILLILAFLLGACASSKPALQVPDEDFCAQIHPPENVPLSTFLDPLRGRMETQTGVYALEEGDVSMMFRAWMIEAAEHTLDLQYFIFTTDNVGLIGIDYFVRAADRGVKVRILIDDITVTTDVADLLAIDAHPNIEIRIYNPVANIGKTFPKKIRNAARDFRGFNHRMHNKTFIADGQVMITGGRNIADEYFDFDHGYNFRDRDVLMVGEAVAAADASFEAFWNSRLSRPLSRLVSLPEHKVNAEATYQALRQYACNPSNYWPQVRQKIASAPLVFNDLVESGLLIWTDLAYFISDDPGKNDGTEGLGGGGRSTEQLIDLVRNATESIRIDTPYLVTTGLSHGLIREARARGVEITILTNSMAATDNLEAFSGYVRSRQTLLDLGVTLYEFKPDAQVRYEVMTGALQRELDFAPTFGLHSKSMVVDGRISVIGTFNIDPRSANLNTECMAVIYDEAFTERLMAFKEVDVRPENAWRIRKDFNPDKHAGWKKRFGVWWRSKLVPKSVL